VRKDEEQVMDVSTLRMRETTIVYGILLTFVVTALGELYVALTWAQPHRLVLALLFASASATAINVALLPRERIVRSRLREPFFLGWTLLDFAMLLPATIADGGTSSPVTLVFFLPVVFSAMSYPLGSVVAVGFTSVLTYLTIAVAQGGASVAFEAGFAAALLCTAVISAAQAQNHKRQHHTLARASRTDPLTGCLNRRGFEERADAELGAMRRRGRTGAIVMLDVDKFKLVNDTLGHAAGDELLCWTTATLAEQLRASDAVGRLGGDEFAALLPEISAEDAQASAERAHAALGARAPASIGLAMYPADGTTLEDLIHVADARLYASRRERRAKAAREGLPEPGAPASGDGGARGVDAIEMWRAALAAVPGRAIGRVRTPEEGPGGRELLDEIDASVIVTDMDGVVLSWNSGAQSLYGWSPEEAVGRNARELVVPQDPTEAQRLVENISRDGRWDGELLVCRKDRSTFTAYTRNRLILDAEGNPSAIVGVAVDVSARVAAEAELLHSRDYATAVTECVAEGLFTLDPEGAVTWANPTAETLLGWDEGTLAGTLVVESILAPAADGSPSTFSASQLAGALQHEETVRVDDAAFRTRDGRELPVAYAAAPFSTSSGVQGCVVIFQDITERRRLEEEQRRDAATLACINRVEDALAEDRFVLYAQPIIALPSGETIQHELLLRMRERDGRVIAPGEFLPAAERYALIGEIDWWVIKQATQLAGEGTPVELNISARSVGDMDVLEHVQRCIAQWDVKPGMLVFEITETAVISDERAARTFCTALHELGCEIALDDFGTGYSGLTYLKQLPLDYLKLDIEFVRDVATNAASRHVVQAVLELARNFELRTVAEGVEDARTLELLRELGVDFAQGFHIGRPAAFTQRPGDQAGHAHQKPPAGRSRARLRSRAQRLAAR
jgi:diguanylate cyclase (GGDEF)-like protein/PAS domain S-box-containing protein